MDTDNRRPVLFLFNDSTGNLLTKLRQQNDEGTVQIISLCYFCDPWNFYCLRHNS